MQMVNPSLIIEVGSFVGESAIHMAKLVKIENRDCPILCVDTWYAGFDHWKGAREKIQMHFGRPDLFYKFMANVIEHGCQDVIVPLASDSLNAARILKWLGIVPGLIYVDGSHEQGDALRDYEAYWDLLPPGGGLLVDDLTNWFPGVLHDWATFTEYRNLTPVLTEGEKALVIKP
jgi:predicted O-methyltransferase YrrM